MFGLGNMSLFQQNRNTFGFGSTVGRGYGCPQHRLGLDVLAKFVKRRVKRLVVGNVNLAFVRLDHQMGQFFRGMTPFDLVQISQQGLFVQPVRGAVKLAGILL